MYSEFLKIEVSGLPTIYPSTTFVDKYFTTNRIVNDGFYEEVLTTAEKYSKVNDLNFEQRNIQILVYNKYQLKIFAKESTQIELIKYADVVNITGQNGIVHRAKILSLEKAKAGVTQGLVYTLNYADKNEANYPNNSQQVVNFLRSDSLVGSLNSLTFSNSSALSSEWTELSNTYTINTLLSPIVSTANLAEKTQEINNLKIRSKQIVNNQLVLTFYLTEAQSKIVSTYLPMCLIAVSTINSSVHSGTYTALENIIPEIKAVSGAIDLYECNISLIYENIVYNNYNN